MNRFHFQKEPFFIFFLGFAIIFAILTMPGCAHPNMPRVDVKFWAGSSADSGIVRKQDNEILSCSQPQFDDYACINYSDIKKIYAAMLQCKKWGPPLATKEEVSDLADKNHEIIKNVIESK